MYRNLIFIAVFSIVSFNHAYGKMLIQKELNLNDSIIKKNDTLRFNYVAEYKELRKNNGEITKRYYLINANDSVLNRRYYIFEKDSKLVLKTSLSPYDVEFPFDRKLLNFNKSLVFHVEKDQNLAMKSKTYFSKADKIEISNKSKLKLKKNKLIFKTKIYFGETLIKEYKEVYDTTDERFKILMFAKSFTTHKEINANTKGVLKFTEYFDYDVQSKISLSLKKILPAEITIIVDKNAKRFPVEIDSLEKID